MLGVRQVLGQHLAPRTLRRKLITVKQYIHQYCHSHAILGPLLMKGPSVLLSPSYPLMISMTWAANTGPSSQYAPDIALFLELYEKPPPTAVLFYRISPISSILPPRVGWRAGLRGWRCEDAIGVMMRGRKRSPNSQPPVMRGR